MSELVVELDLSDDAHKVGVIALQLRIPEPARNVVSGREVDVSMTTWGFIGSGNIGTTVARLAVTAGHDVVLSNSRGPQTLADVVDKLGPRARAATPAEAARAGDVVVVTIPLRNYLQVPVEEPLVTSAGPVPAVDAAAGGEPAHEARPRRRRRCDRQRVQRSRPHRSAPSPRRPGSRPPGGVA